MSQGQPSSAGGAGRGRSSAAHRAVLSLRHSAGVSTHSDMDRTAPICRGGGGHWAWEARLFPRPLTVENRISLCSARVMAT